MLGAGDSNVDWMALDVGPATQLEVIHDVRSLAVGTGRTVIEAARAEEARDAIEAGEFRLLCAHRRGPEGVGHWTGHIEHWLGAEVEGFAAGDGLVSRAAAHRH